MNDQKPCLPGCRTIEAAPFDSDHLPGCPNAPKPCPHGKWRAINGIFRCVKCGEDYVPNPNGPHANAPKPPEAPKSKCPVCGMSFAGYHYCNLKPAPATEPKCYHCETCRNQCSPKTGQPICCNCKRELAAPEPRGSACPGCGHRVHGAVCLNFGSDNECPCMAGAKQGIEEPLPSMGKATDWPPSMDAYLALRAEVEELKADKERRKGSAVDRLHNLCDGFDEMDKEQQAKIDALRAQLAEKERMIAAASGMVGLERDAREKAEVLLPDLLAIIKQPSRHGLNWAAVDQAEAILATMKGKSR